MGMESYRTKQYLYAEKRISSSGSFPPAPATVVFLRLPAPPANETGFVADFRVKIPAAPRTVEGAAGALFHLMKLKTLAVKHRWCSSLSIVAVASPAPFAPAAARHPVPHPDARRRVQRDRRRGRHQQGRPARHRLRRALVRGPSWTKHKFRELGFSNNYIDDFSDLPVDVDGDGYPDIATVTWFAKKVSWFRNPAKARGRVGRGADQLRLQHRVRDPGRHRQRRQGARDRRAGERHRAVVRSERGGWTEPGVKHVVSDRSYGHGIGAGDVNKDGRNDILTPRGWLEAPADPRAPATGPTTPRGNR